MMGGGKMSARSASASRRHGIGRPRRFQASPTSSPRPVHGFTTELPRRISEKRPRSMPATPAAWKKAALRRPPRPIEMLRCPRSLPSRRMQVSGSPSAVSRSSAACLTLPGPISASIPRMSFFIPAKWRFDLGGHYHFKLARRDATFRLQVFNISGKTGYSVSGSCIYSQNPSRFVQGYLTVDF